MTEEDKLLFFMPVVTSSLTSAVYSCQLKNPDLNPEEAMSHVILTWHRVCEVFSEHVGKSSLRDKQIGDMILSELQRVQSRLADISKQSPRAGLQEEVAFLVQQASFFVQLSSFLVNP
jgi:hypothetical protein